MTRPNKLDRRSFLTTASGGVASLLIGCGDDAVGSANAHSDAGETTTGHASSSEGDGSQAQPEDGQTVIWSPDAVARDAAVFPLAVMAGEMRPHSAMFTVYISDGAPKTFRVWRPGADPQSVVLVHEAQVEPNGAGFVKVTVSGLSPGTWYAYGYFAGPPSGFSGRSHIGHVRTAIGENELEPVVIALASCCGPSLDWPALDRSSEEYYDVLLHLGDMAYNDGMETLKEYRASWRSWMSTPAYHRAFASAGMFATWDDHEIDDNSNFDPETMDPAQLTKRENAMRAYFELLPIDAWGSGDRLWRSFRWGLTAEIIVLDCRYERQPSEGRYISDAQMLFLEDRLLNSPCRFKLVMNSVPITNMPEVWNIAANDRWDGYPDARNRLKHFINDNRIQNVWFVSGDFHTTFVSRLEPQGDDVFANVREIACASGNANPVPAAVLGLAPPQFDYGRSETRGVILTLDPSDMTLTVRCLHPETGEDDYLASMRFGE